MKKMVRIIGLAKWVLPRHLFIHCLAMVCILPPLFRPIPVAADSHEDSAKWMINGFLEVENFVNTYEDQEYKDAVKKNEIHNRLEVKYGVDNLYIFVKSDLYYLPDLFDKETPNDYRYADEENTVARNLRISGRRYDWAFNEFYLNYMIPPLRLRLGNQMFLWGTADVFNPTAYFNPHDFREFFFRDDDELKQGVPALSAMFFFDNFTTELVYSFVHVPMQFAEQGNFWSVDMSRPHYNINLQESEGMDAIGENTGVGGRISTSFLNTDISISGYHGPDREFVQRPVSVDFLPNSSPIFTIEQYYDMVNMVGIDLSKALGNFVFQFECAYSPDKPNIVKQDFSRADSLQVPFEIRKSDYVAYAAGFNYFVPISILFENHTGEAVFTLDWYEAYFYDEKLAEPNLTDILTLRFQDSYFDGRFNIKMTAMFETRFDGTIYWPEIKYDFLNGWSAELAYVDIDGNLNGESVDPLFYHFRDNDMAVFKVRYDF